MAIKLFQNSSKKALEKRFTTFTEQLAGIFGKIKEDINQTSSRTDILEGELKHLKSWVNYLYTRNSQLESQNEGFKQKIARIDEKNEQLHTSHRILASETDQVSLGLESHQEHLKHHKNEVSGILESHMAKLQNALQGHQNLNEDELERLKGWISYFQAHLDKQKSRESTLVADIASLRDSLDESSFSSKNTINLLKSDNLALKQYTDQLSNQLQNLTSELSEAQNDLKNTQKNIENLQNLAKSETLEPIQQQVEQQIQPQAQVLPPQESRMAYPDPSSFQQHIISRVMPNRKGYIMNFIKELVSEGRYSTKEIEEMVVKEKNLCGRTSFYAYLKEMKYRGKIGYADIDDRSMLVNLENQHNQHNQ
ncbi:hypothetical protein ACFL0V_00770 [Nanoarchaeota archaeon]